jgi:hypothetical protein
VRLEVNLELAHSVSLVGALSSSSNVFIIHSLLYIIMPMEDDDLPSDNGVILSETMSNTIRKLERLVDEAVMLAAATGERATDESIPQLSVEQPTIGMARRISQYLGQMSAGKDKARPAQVRKRRSLTDPAPYQGEARDSNARRSRAATSAENLPLLVPEPVAEPLQERKRTLSRGNKRGTSAPEEEASGNRSPSRYLTIPKRNTQASSAQPNTPGPISPMSMPAIQLNGGDLDVAFDEDNEPLLPTPRPGHARHFSQVFGVPSRHVSVVADNASSIPRLRYKIDLNGARHVDVAAHADDLDIHSTCHHATVARNWPNSRKRLTAIVACLNSACLGLLIGIYAGEVPAIQYVVVDLNRCIILGNVFLYIGLALATLFCWPLPLLHGRKPYTLTALIVALFCQLPQGLMVVSFRDPDISRYRVTLLLSRGFSGFALGFAEINNLASLLDVFGAFLQSKESRNQGNLLDVRRYGGGMGLWLSA